jgi:hypothetical protein
MELGLLVHGQSDSDNDRLPVQARDVHVVQLSCDCKERRTIAA